MRVRVRGQQRGGRRVAGAGPGGSARSDAGIPYARYPHVPPRQKNSAVGVSFDAKWSSFNFWGMNNICKLYIAMTTEKPVT